MNAKDYLEHLTILKNKMLNCKLALEEWESAMGYQSPRFDLNGIRATSAKNKMDMMTNRWMELSKGLEAVNSEYEAYKKEVMTNLGLFSQKYSLEATILIAKYVNMKTFDEIESMLHYSARWLKKLNKRALILFEDFMEKEGKL